MTQEAPTHLVDARELSPPEPMHRVLEALAGLPQGGWVRLLLYREPFPLYAVLKREGFVHAARLDDDGTFTIDIRRAP